MSYSDNQKAIHTKLIVTLANEIDDEEYLDRLKGLIRADVGAGRLAKTKSSQKLMELMQDCGLLSVGKYEKLKYVIKTAGLQGLVEMIEHEEARINHVKSPETERKRPRLGTDASTGSSFESDPFTPSPRVPIQVAPGMGSLPPDRVYPTERFRHKGLVVIINNFTEEREGTDHDVNYLQRVFGDDVLRYTVLSGPGYSNLSKEKFNSKLQYIKGILQELPGYNRFFLIIMSHGDKNGIRTCKEDGKTWDKEIITVDEITQIFRDIPRMLDFPKVFIVQACRGENLQRAILRSDTCPSDDSEYLNLRMENMRIQIETPIDADILVAYATTPGHIAWRETDRGSWFINNLCHVIENEHRNEHFVDILTETSRYVADRTAKRDSNGITTTAKQMPVFVSTLRKKMYLIDV